MRIHAIGDVHGRLDLLTRMHAVIANALERDRPADWRIIHLGDYVDRGPDSKGVIDFLIEAKRRDPRHLMLAGNHDVGFLDFLAKPDPDGLFMRYGGVETAQSYRVALLNDRSGRSAGAEQDFASSHAALVEAVLPSHVEFLRSLAFSATFGDFFFCHAGVRPGVALDAQAKLDLIWIREMFLNYPELHEKIVVHGHTPCDEPEIMANRVNVDTGAFATGLLSALVIDGADKRIFSVGP